MASGQVGWEGLAEPSQGYRTSGQNLDLKEANDTK